MSMERLTEKEMKEALDVMLDNASIEEELQRWKQEEGNPILMMELLEAVTKRAKEEGGLIVSVKSDGVPAGAENIEFFQKEKNGDVNIITDNYDRHFAMVFTSKERFKLCDDTSGFVMFIDELFTFLGERPEIDGMMINWKKEDVVFDKEMMRTVLRMMES